MVQPLVDSRIRNVLPQQLGYPPLLQLPGLTDGKDLPICTCPNIPGTQVPFCTGPTMIISLDEELAGCSLAEDLTSSVPSQLDPDDNTTAKATHWIDTDDGEEYNAGDLYQWVIY